MKTTKIGNMSMAYTADDANTLYILGKDKTISSGDYGLDVFSTMKNRDFEINGLINAGIAGVRIGDETTDAPPVDFETGKDAKIIAGASGITAWGDGHKITNAGTISAGATGIAGHGDQTITNTGTIVGGTDGIAAYGEQTVVNRGEISGTNGVNLFSTGGETATVTNFGTISGMEWSILGSSLGDKIINKGDLKGDVSLGYGDDTFIYKGGLIDGVLRGGAGDDTYYARATGLNIVEDVDSGTDTVRASIDFELQANVDDLYLIGKGNIDGTGNSSDNELHGNAGKNQLSAGFGFDILNGGAGNDRLEGGVGADEFHFDRGTGKDVIADYEATFDDLHFVDLKGASTFADMIDNHAVEKGDNVVITFGKDVIVIKDHLLADLQAADFHFT